jgi:hypothetical protein
MNPDIVFLFSASGCLIVAIVLSLFLIVKRKRTRLPSCNSINHYPALLDGLKLDQSRYLTQSNIFNYYSFPGDTPFKIEIQVLPNSTGNRLGIQL